jgi:hypothetical protein
MKIELRAFRFSRYFPAMIQRPGRLTELRTAFRRSRVVVLVGPRQAGKTTLASSLVSPASPNYFDLENPLSLSRLAEPMTALGPLGGIVVIDEIHRRGAVGAGKRVERAQPLTH